MPKQRGKIGKYCKISLQKKFQLLKLTQWGTINLKQTSELLNINYSTAKTIFFQFQNKKARQKLTFFGDQCNQHKQQENLRQNKRSAAYKMNDFSTTDYKKIKVICTENRKDQSNEGNQVYQYQFLSNPSQIKEKSSIIMDQEDKNCKTVCKNQLNFDDNTKSSKKDKEQIVNSSPVSHNSYKNQDQLELASYWQNISYQNTIMNLSQFPYYVDFMGNSLTFPFLLSVPQ